MTTLRTVSAMPQSRSSSHWLFALTLLATLVAIGVGCGGGGDEAEKPEAVSQTFVGTTPGTKPTPATGAFVAAVAAPERAESGRLQVGVYLCDGRRIDEWFPGSAQDGRFKIPSDDGDAEVRGTLTDDAVRGTVELPDARRLSFEARPATGTAGLYDVKFLRTGAVRGSSETGGRLVGKLGKPGRLGRKPPLRRYPVTGSITAPNGDTLDLAGKAGAWTNDPSEWRWVVLPNGQIRGGTKTRTTSGGSDFAYWIGLD